VSSACSRFRTDSEVSRLNRAGGREMAISRYFADALAAALKAAQATDGDVDPTCGRSLIALGYDRDFTRLRTVANPRPDTHRRIVADLARFTGKRRDTGIGAAPAAGWRAVELDQQRCIVRVPEGELIDLGATAKALAADRAASRIAAMAGCGVLVNLGGDISVAGRPPEGGWRVGIVDELGPGEAADAMAPAQVVVIVDGGLATSSTTARAWRCGTATVHHIVVPATGLPARTCWRTASVAAASCVDANTASTAAIIRGERAPGWLRMLGVPARLVRHDGTVLAMSGWPAEVTGTADGGAVAGRPGDGVPAGLPA
jgi:FAD:protein FMN transferase